MYKHARTHYTRKNRKIILTFAVLLTATAILFGMCFAAMFSAGAHAAPIDPAVGTMLSDGGGLVFGANRVRTSGGNSDNQSYGSGNPQSANLYGSDFWFDYGTEGSFNTTHPMGEENTVSFSNEMMSLKYYTLPTSEMTNAQSFYFRSKIKLDPAGAIYTNLKSAQSTVTFSVSAEVRASDGADEYEDGLSIDWFFSDNGVNSNVRNAKNHTATGDWETVSSEVRLTKASAATLNLTEKAYFQINIGGFSTSDAKTAQSGGGIQGPTTGIMVDIRNVTVTVSVSTDDGDVEKMNYGPLGVRVVGGTGSVRRPDEGKIYVGLESVKDDTRYTADGVEYKSDSLIPLSNRVYIRHGDTVFLYADVELDGSPIAISPDYAEAMGAEAGTMPISWIYGSESQYKLFECLDFVKPTEQSSVYAQNGKTSEFYYNKDNSRNNVTLNLLPQFITGAQTGTDGGKPVFSYLGSSTTVNLTFDNIKPSEIKLSANDGGIGEYGAKSPEEALARPYTASTKVPFTFEQGKPQSPTQGNDIAPETLYYTLTAVGEPEKDPLTSPDRKVLKIENGDGGYIEFPSGRGTEAFKLQMVVIDAAGNHSGVYEKYICVDTNKYNIIANFRKGTTGSLTLIPGTQDANAIASIRFFDGSQKRWISGKTTQTGASAEFGRTVGFSMQIRMTKNQFEKYKLVSVKNGSNDYDKGIFIDEESLNRPIANPSEWNEKSAQIGFYTEGTGERAVYTYTITYVMASYGNVEMDDPNTIAVEHRTFDFLSAGAARDFTFTFKERAVATVSLVEPEFKFEMKNGVPTAVPQDIAVSFNDFDNIDYKVKYYRLTQSAVSAGRTMDGVMSIYSTPQAAEKAGFVELMGSDEFPESPSLAGEYWYWVYIPEGSATGHDRDYYIDKGGKFTIKKAAPKVKDVAFSDGDGKPFRLVYSTAGGMQTILDKRIIKGIGPDGEHYSHEYSSIGVPGEYVIKSPTRDALNYQSPVAGQYTVVVAFNPANVGGILSSDNFRSSEDIMLELTVIPYEVTFRVAEGQPLSTVYDRNGAPQPFAVEVSFDNLTWMTEEEARNKVDTTFSLVYNYKPEGQLSFSATQPTNAGRYDVKVSVSPTVANYRGTFSLFEREEEYYVIEKERLFIEYDFEENYVYSYYSAPTPRAYRLLEGDLPEWVERNRSFEITYRKEGDTEFSTNVPYDAGVYFAKIKIVAVNYDGETEEEIRFTVLKADLVNSENRLNANFPTATASAYSETGAHAVYGNRLGDVKLTSGNAYNVTYTRGGQSRPTVVPGVFRFAESPEEYESLGLSDDVSAELRTHINTPLDAVGKRTAVLLFIPDDRNNYGVLYRALDITVDKATPSDADLRFADIIYGQTFAEAELLGKMFINKAVYDPNDTSVLDVKETVDGEIRFLNAQGSAVYPVGDIEILAEFIPNDAAAVNFYKKEFSVTLNVLKQPAEITAPAVISSEYGRVASLDGSASVSVAGEKLLYRVFLTAATSTDTEISEAVIGEQTEFSRKLTAGLYIAEIYIGENSNYSARKFVYLMINKSTPEVVQRLEITDFEIGDDVYSYQNEKGWAGLTVATHADPVFAETVEGVLSLKSGQTPKYDDAGRYPYLFVFKPSGNYALNYEETEVELYVAVGKTTVSLTVSPSGMSKVYTGGVLRPTVNVEGADLTDADLVWSSDPVEAGSYNLTVKVRDDSEKFRGSLEIRGFAITRDEAAQLEVKVDKTAWTGEDIFADGEIFGLSAESGIPTEFSVSYTDYIGNPVGAMTEIGRYQVKIVLGGNYAGTLTFDFFVTPKNVIYDGEDDGAIVRVYNPESTMTGRVTVAEVIPETAEKDGTVEYAALDSRGNVVGEFAETVPYLAGRYRVRTRFSANGFNGSDEGVVLVIEKAQAEVTRAPLGEYVYSGKAPEISIAFRQTGLSYTLEYAADGGEFSRNPNISAGDGYRVKVTVENDNYRGEFIYPYIIKKGELSLVGTVSIASVPYGTALDELSPEALTEKFSYARAFMFGNAYVEGTFRLTTTGIETLPVWQYDINYVFTPNDTSLEEYHGAVNLSVVRRDISSWLEVDGTTLNAVYDGRQKTVSLKFKAEYAAKLSASVRNGILSSVNIAYGGQSSAPVNAGGYDFTASLGHVNYSANIKGKLEIEKATPDVVAPDPVATLASGATLTEDGRIVEAGGKTVDLNAMGSVYAVIPSNGVPVVGRFGISGESAGVLSGANRKAVKVRFTPDDEDNFNAAETYIYLMLRKTSADAEVGISAVTLPNIPVYGKTLAEAYNLPNDLTVSGAWSAEFAKYGGFRFVNPDFVPSVGVQTVKILFELNETYVDGYNNKEFETSIRVEEKKNVEIAGDVYFDVRIGSVYGDGKFVLPEDFAYLSEAGRFAVSEKATDIVERADISAGTSIGYTYESANYTVSAGRATVKLLILSEEFSVANKSADYRDGGVIGKNELFGLTGISVPNISSVSGGFVFRIFKDGAEVENMSDAGVYQVVASISRSVGIGAGEVSFDFTVTPKNLSDYIILNGGAESLSTVYLSGIRLFPELTGEAANIENIDFLFYYKKAGDPDSEFSVYDRPQNAGEYVVRVSVEGSDCYAGYRDYPYIVEKKAVDFTVGTKVYTYGAAREPEIIVSDGLTRADYVISYRSEEGVMFQTVPVDAGTYNATVVVTNENYSGTHSFAYTINREKTVVSEWATLGDIVYGQPLSASNMKLPAVMPSVSGRFELEEPSLILGAGERTVKVRYVPDNRNYTTETYDVEITVRKAQTGLNFAVVGKQYIGSALYPSVTVPGDAGLADFVKFDFYRLVNGNYVATDAPVLPGTYYVRARLEHDNYTYTMEAGVYREFNVYRAEVLSYEAPAVSPIAYGKSLEGNSAISGGSAVYFNGTDEGIRVAGRFSFVNGNVSLGDAGEGKIIKLKFTPDNANYEPFEFETTVDVVKATGSLTVSSGNSSVYGTPVSYPTLTVAPDSTLRVRYDDGFEAMIGGIYDVGQYTVRAFIDDVNYTGEVTFTYSVTRAPVELVFTDGEGNIVDNYTFEYGDDANGRIFAAVADSFAGDKEAVVPYFDFTYTSADGAITYDGFARILQNAGSYRVTVSVSSGSNFTGSAYVDVRVTKRTVDEVLLPVETLQEQVYGSVSRPTVQIYKDGRIITGVSYYIDYGDSGKVMPTRAGTYMIMVVIDDRDYEPYRKQATFVINKKTVKVEDITVENKLFDGVSGIAIDGNLTGVLLGDEVNLDMSARVKDGAIDPGTYGVDIVSYSLRGLDAGNYSLETPVYNGSVTITSNRLYDKAEGGSYLIYGDNVSKTAEFSVGAVDSPLNKEGFFSSMLGQKAEVVSFSIRENGIKTELSAPVKVYIKIPERFAKVANITVEGLGNLADSGISFSREGDYITFYTTLSGEIVFSVSEFPYGILLIGIALVVLVVGFLAIRLLDPARHKLGIKTTKHRYDAVKTETARYNELKRQAERKPPKETEPKKKKKKK